MGIHSTRPQKKHYRCGLHFVVLYIRCCSFIYVLMCLHSAFRNDKQLNKVFTLSTPWHARRLEKYIQGVEKGLEPQFLSFEWLDKIN